MVKEAADEALGDRVGADFEDGGAGSGGDVLEVLQDVVVSDAGGDDAEGFIGRVEVELVERGGVGEADQLGLELLEALVAAAGQVREKRPAFAGAGFEGVFLAGSAGFDAGPGVGDAGRQADHDRDVEALREVVGLAGHVVGFLVVGRLKARDQGELGIEAAVLLVLGAVHARVVGRDEGESAVDAEERGAHERVGGDVEPDVLEGDEGPAAGIGGAEGFFEGRFLVGRPGGPVMADFAIGPEKVFHDFRSRGSGIGVGRGQAGVDGAKRYGLIAEKNLFGHGHVLSLNWGKGRISPGAGVVKPEIGARNRCQVIYSPISDFVDIGE